MKILITGATGFIGKALTENLMAHGHQVLVVTRNAKSAQLAFTVPVEVLEWNLMREPLPAEAFLEVEAVIHLLGESIDGYWTASKKNKIIESRETSSKNLLKNIPAKVQVVVSASAQGIYGDRGDEVLTENSELGEGFLASTCKVWEKQFHLKAKENLSTRFIILRIGMVLDPQGGALKKVLSIFSKNLGAVLGSGRQWISWISRRDLVAVFTEAIENKKYRGIYNAVQPFSLQNADFTAILCQSLNVFQAPRVPALALRLFLGEMSSLVLQSQRVDCQRLKEQGFQFQDLDLKDFLHSHLRP